MKSRFLIISSLVVTSLAVVSFVVFGYMALYTSYGINSLVNNLNQSDHFTLENVNGTLGEGFSFGKITFESQNHKFEFISGEVKYDNLFNLMDSDDWSLESLVVEKANFHFKKSSFSEVSYSDIDMNSVNKAFKNFDTISSYIPANLSVRKLLIKTADIYDSEKLAARTAELLFEGLQFVERSIYVKNFSIVSSHIDAYGLDMYVNEDLGILAGPKGIDGYFKKPLLGMLKREIKFRVYGGLPITDKDFTQISLDDGRMTFKMRDSSLSLTFSEFRPYLYIETLPSIEQITGEFEVGNLKEWENIKSRLLVRFYSRDFMFGLGDKMGVSERPPLENMRPREVDNFAAQGIPLYYRNGNDIFELRFLYKHLIKYNSLSRAMLIRANKDFENVEAVLANLLYGLELDRLPIAQKQEVLSEASRFIPTIKLENAIAMLEEESTDSEAGRSTASTED